MPRLSVELTHQLVKYKYLFRHMFVHDPFNASEEACTRTNYEDDDEQGDDIGSTEV